MTSNYDRCLPVAFPYLVEVPHSVAKEAVQALVYLRSDVPNLSSFAVTADARMGWTKLWLSTVSLKWLGMEEGNNQLSKDSQWIFQKMLEQEKQENPLRFM
jgi:hypothetical protein